MKADHDDAISAEQRVDERFAEEHTVGHIQNSSALLVTDILEPNGVTDLVGLSGSSCVV